MTRTQTGCRSLLALAMCLAANSAMAGGAAPKEAGVWYDDSGKGAVKVQLCGAKLCGTIYWLKDPLNAEGKPLFDRHNPNEGQRSRPICGLQVFGELAKMDDGTWDSGWIYDPKEGKSYSVAMYMESPEVLKVTGYIGLKLMGRTLTWKRAPVDLPACQQTAAAPAPAAGGAAAATTKKATATGGAAPAATKTSEELPWADKKAPAGAAASKDASKLGGAKAAPAQK